MESVISEMFVRHPDFLLFVNDSILQYIHHSEVFPFRVVLIEYGVSKFVKNTFIIVLFFVVNIIYSCCTCLSRLHANRFL